METLSPFPIGVGTNPSSLASAMELSNLDAIPLSYSLILWLGVFSDILLPINWLGDNLSSSHQFDGRSCSIDVACRLE